MADYGIDPWWMSHEPWIVPEPFTPEAGSCGRRRTSTTGISVVAQIAKEARETPNWSRTAPHNQAIAQVKVAAFEDPNLWAMTWRAWLRKRGGPVAERGAA